MAIKNRGARVATNNMSTHNHVDLSSIGRGGVIAPRALPDGEHALEIRSARHVVSKAGNVSVLLDISTADGTPVRIRPMLVHSAGGMSDMTVENLMILEQLAGLSGDELTLDKILPALDGREVRVELLEVADREGRPANDIIDVIASQAS